MKKRLTVIGVVLVLGILISCLVSKGEVVDVTGEKKLRVLSTTAMIEDIVRQIGGERISSAVLIQGAIDPHSYELVKGDDEKIDFATIVFFNGLHLEHGASLQSKLSKHPYAISVGDYILSKYSDCVLFEEGQLDPHIWMDISLWAKIVEPIVESFCIKDPEGKEYYEARGRLVQEKMNQFHLTLKEKLHQVPENRRYLVTSHDAFGYFTRSYLASEEDLKSDTWRKRFAAPEGLAPDGQLGVMDLQKIINYLAEYQVDVVFPESNVSRDSLKKIVFACKEKNIPIRFSHNALYGDCMGESNSYLEMIEHNGSVLIKEWSSFP
ncbi:MAG: zinc ABC transporter substrate-binding protein [Verrucomicrobia bacterium]|nr:zinc ABC transporter substrate-binding protein [Verrucomicrobiota bacterium]